MQHLHKVASLDAPFRQQKLLRVKLSGDGTNIGKHLHVMNITFTLLDEGSLAYSAEGNHALAIIKEQENYASLQNALEDISEEVGRLTTIEVDEVTYSIQYYLGGDWKFLAIVTGIDSAKSEIACIWCKCGKAERHDMSKCWSILDPTFGARTVEENIKLSQQRQIMSHTLPCSPQFPSNVWSLTIYTFLRVSDVSIMRLID